MGSGPLRVRRTVGPQRVPPPLLLTLAASSSARVEIRTPICEARSGLARRGGPCAGLTGLRRFAVCRRLSPTQRVYPPGGRSAEQRGKLQVVEKTGGT